MDKIKIILVEDHQLVLDGIKSILQKEQDLEVIAEASNYNDLKIHLGEGIPDIILMDISLPEISGIEITKIINQEYPEIKVIMLSMHVSEEFIMNSVSAGAKGYIPKNTTRKELLTAIRTVKTEGQYFTQSVSSIILKNIVRNAKNESIAESNNQSLTKREIEILKLFAEGWSNGEIADKLYISSRTVESHKNHIMMKLDMKSPVELVKFAIKHKLTDL